MAAPAAHSLAEPVRPQPAAEQVLAARTAALLVAVQPAPGLEPAGYQVRAETPVVRSEAAEAVRPVQQVQAVVEPSARRVGPPELRAPAAAHPVVVQERAARVATAAERVPPAHRDKRALPAVAG